MRPDLNLILGGVGLVRGDIRESGRAMVEIAKEINPFLVGDSFLAQAPFRLLHGIIRFGVRFEPYAEVGPIDRVNQELPFAVEVELDPLRNASVAEVKAEFLRALIPATFAISIEYDLPVNGLTAFGEQNGFVISPAEDEGA